MPATKSQIFTIPRRSIAGMEGMWAKMWDPPTESPATPELLTPTNPVPAFMAATIPGAKMSTLNTVQRELIDGVTITGWDGTPLAFMCLRGQRHSRRLRRHLSGPDHPGAPGGGLPLLRPWARGRRPTPSTGTASSPPP